MMTTGPHDSQPGDVVTYTVGPTLIRTRVVEDRGHIGVGGRQLVRIEGLGE